MARILEHLGNDICFLLLTTSESLPHAKASIDLLKNSMRGGFSVYIDRDIYGVSVYEELFRDFIGPMDKLRNLAHSIGFKRIIAVDVTGGIKLESVLLTNIGYMVLRKRGESLFLSYTSGEGFARNSPFRRGWAGWWGGRSYPETPRALQHTLIVGLDTQAIEEPRCRPELVRRPTTISYELPSAGLNSFQKTMGLMARLFNSLSCKTVKVYISLSTGTKKISLIEVDWANAELTYIPHDFSDTINSALYQGHGSSIDSINYAAVNNRNGIKCFKTLATMSLSEPMVLDTSIGGVEKGKRLSELFSALGGKGEWCSGFKGLLFDTSVIYQGLLNSILAAEVALILQGIKNIAQKCPFYAPSCVADEIYRHVMEEIKNSKGGAANPCAVRGLNGLIVLAALETLDSSACYCDRALIEAAEKHNLLLVTGDTGIINIAKMKNLHYIYTKPKRIEETPSKPWQRHQALAAALQLTLNIAASIDYNKAKVIVKGDKDAVQLRNKGIGKNKIEITILQAR